MIPERGTQYAQICNTNGSHSKLYRSVEELCADRNLQLIVVNTPTHLHYQQAKLVLQSGKHLVIEKPFTVTVKEAEELAPFAEKNNLFVSVYQNRRYDGDYRAVKEVLHQGLLGDLREAEKRYDRYRPSFGGKQHKEGDLPGAGILYDLSPHLVDQAIQLFGFPKAVFADVWRMREDVEAPDYFEILSYYDKLRVRLKATCIARESTYAYTLHGMKGSFLQQRSDMQEQQLQAGVKPLVENGCPAPAAPDGLLHTEISGEVVRKETPSSPGNYMGYYDYVYKALTGRDPTRSLLPRVVNFGRLNAALDRVENPKQFMAPLVVDAVFKAPPTFGGLGMTLRTLSLYAERGTTYFLRAFGLFLVAAAGFCLSLASPNSLFRPQSAGLFQLLAATNSNCVCWGSVRPGGTNCSSRGWPRFSF